MCLHHLTFPSHCAALSNLRQLRGHALRATTRHREFLLFTFDRTRFWLCWCGELLVVLCVRLKTRITYDQNRIKCRIMQRTHYTNCVLRDWDWWALRNFSVIIAKTSTTRQRWRWRQMTVIIMMRRVFLRKPRRIINGARYCWWTNGREVRTLFVYNNAARRPTANCVLDECKCLRIWRQVTIITWLQVIIIASRMPAARGVTNAIVYTNADVTYAVKTRWRT